MAVVTIALALHLPLYSASLSLSWPTLNDQSLKPTILAQFAQAFYLSPSRLYYILLRLLFPHDVGLSAHLGAKELFYILSLCEPVP
jgi:hypothetical protein